MISHAITVFKAPAVVTWVAPAQQQPTGLASQEELDKFILECPFSVGDYLSLAANPITSLAMVHRVVEIETDFKKVILSGYHKKPNFMRMLQCNMNVPQPWIRWDSPPGYRLLSIQELKTFIEPNCDQLQNYCTKWA